MTVRRILGQAMTAAACLTIVGGATAATASSRAPGPSVGRAVPGLSPPLRDLPTIYRPVSRGLPARVRATERVEGLSVPSPDFDGIPLQPVVCNCIPAAPTGDVGPNDYVQAVNLSLEVFDRTGGPLMGPVSVASIWTSLGGVCAGAQLGWPQVQYDQLADRWIVSVTAGLHLDTQCFAVSQTSDPTGAYYLYAFPLGSCELDAEIGVWPDGYYLGYNGFDSTCANLVGPQVFVFDRAKMLLGQAATSQTFGPFLPNPGNGSTPLLYPLPADLEGASQPAPGTPEFYFGLDPIGSSIGVGELHVDWTTPASSTFTALPSLATAPFTFLCPGTRSCVPQAGTTAKLDGLGDRLMYRAPYRVIGATDAVVLNHAVSDPGSGVAGVRWYEIHGLAGGSPSIIQQGTYAQADGSWRWAGSIAMDRAGNIALGFSESSAQINPRIRYTGRLAGDPSGTMAQAEQSIIDGAGSQLSFANRWGDYTTMSVDPTDGCTFWYVNEYYATSSNNNWLTRIGAFKFSGPGECNPPTAVEIARFSARWTRGGVAVTWRTASEARILGFDVFRNGVRLNRALIPANGRSYRHVDRTARRGAFLTYRLRIVDLSGKRTWYGISVVPTR